MLGPVMEILAEGETTAPGRGTRAGLGEEPCDRHGSGCRGYGCTVGRFWFWAKSNGRNLEQSDGPDTVAGPVAGTDSAAVFQGLTWLVGHRLLPGQEMGKETGEARLPQRQRCMI